MCCWKQALLLCPFVPCSVTVKVWCLMVNINFHLGKDENINRSKDKETWEVSDTTLTIHEKWGLEQTAGWRLMRPWSLHAWFVLCVCLRLGWDWAMLATLGSGLGLDPDMAGPHLRQRTHTGAELRLWWWRCHHRENELSRYRLMVVINHRPSFLTIHGPDLYLILPIFCNFYKDIYVDHLTMYHKITGFLNSHFTDIIHVIRCISCNLWDSGICLCSALLQLHWPVPSLCNNCKIIINCCLRNLFNILLPRDEENEIDDVSWDTNWTEFLKDEIQNVAEVDWSAHRGQAD